MSQNFLILCTHNSARSVLAEAMLNHWAQQLNKPVCAYSAGSQPKGELNPFALQVLKSAGINTVGYYSKSWDEFTRPDAPPMRAIITVCDSAAAEVCPAWPGDPLTVHWAYPDPSYAPGGDAAKLQAFELTRQAMGYRMLQLVQQPLEQLNDAALKAALEQIYNN